MGYGQYLNLTLKNHTPHTLVVRDLYLHHGKTYRYPDKSKKADPLAFEDAELLPGGSLSVAVCGGENGLHGVEGEFDVRLRSVGEDVEMNGYSNGANGHANGVNGYGNGYTNGHTNGVNGHSNGINGHTNGHTNGYTNGATPAIKGEPRVCRVYWDCPFHGSNRLTGYYVRDNWHVSVPKVDPRAAIGNQTIHFFVEGGAEV